MKIVIIAGGLGTRIKSVTKNKIPKCMLDINGKPLIQHQIEFFRDKGYKDFIFCIGYLGEQIKEYFKDGSKFGVKIEYSEEPMKLGTAGAVKLIEKKIGGSCAVLYGDLLTNIDIDKMLQFHKSKKSEFTIDLRICPNGYKSSSIVLMDDLDKIDYFKENPELNEEGYINNGIYIMNKSIFKHIPQNQKYDFAKDLIPDLLEKFIKIYGYESKSFFRELGRPEKYEKYKKEIKGKSSIFG